MALQDVDFYWKAIDVLEAREMLVNMTLQDYPNMKKSGRQKVHRDMHGLAYPKTREESSGPVSTKELLNLISGGARV